MIGSRSIVISTLLKRKSVRSFSQKKISKGISDDLIKINNLGPKAGGINCTKIYFCSEGKDKDICFLSSGGQFFLKDSPLIVVIGFKKSDLTKKYSGESVDIFGIQNSSIVASNMILYLTEQEMDSCWVGGFSRTALKKMLGLDFNPEIMLCVGYRRNKDEN